MTPSQLHQARAALQADPTRAQAWVDYIAALIEVGQSEEAAKAAAVARSKGLNDSRLEAWSPSSAANVDAKKSTAPTPEAFDIDRLRTLFHAQRFAELTPIAEDMTARFPDFAFGWSVLGATLAARGLYADALAPFKHAVLLEPTDTSLHGNMAKVYLALNDKQLAEASFQRMLELDNDNTIALAALGQLRHDKSDHDAALTHFTRLSEIDPSRVDAMYNRGNVLSSLGRTEDACVCLDAAIRLDPSFTDAHYNLGLLLHTLGRPQQAVTSFQSALALDPGFVEAHFNLGIVLHAQGAMSDAVRHYLQALKIDPGFVKAYSNLGNALKDQGLIDQALDSYAKALKLHEGHDRAQSNLLFVLNYHPDKPAEEIYEAYAAYEQHFGAALRTHWPSHANAPSQGRRLRIGYVSPDLRRHSVRHFLEPLLASHDRSRFEVFAYAELASEDAVTARYRTYCDHFILTRGMSDEALAARIRSDAIDVLVDVAGHTAGNRLLVLARKPAPVSLSWLGYGYTTGLSAIDYLLTDEASAPVGSEHLFSEAPWRLPCAYAYRPDAGMGEVSALPALTTGHVTFGTLTRAIRINHRTIRVWAEILKRVPRSVLVIDSKNFQHASMQQAMAERFAQHGIGPDQLQIGYHSPPWDTLRAIDIGLDCFPHNSGTTLFETLYMGVPFVTLAGRPSVGRLGRSILHGLGRDDWLEQWCADSEEDYIDKTVALASELHALQRIRSELRPQMQRSALMDELGFAHSVEQAYQQMFERRVNKQAQEVRA